MRPRILPNNTGSGVHSRQGNKESVMATERLTLTVTEAAAVLGISRNACYEAVRTGQLPCLRIGKRLLIPKVQLEKLLQGEPDG